ncbi:MAG: hypothetical protein IRZ08_22520 [Frankia sp.]|nr:hypothetical protein [Frankia sp.]
MARKKGETRYHGADPDEDTVTGIRACDACNGTGQLQRARKDNKRGDIGYEYINCRHCNGTGSVSGR